MTISNNTASNNTGTGIGVYFDNNGGTISGNTVIGNKASDDGGGIFSASSGGTYSDNRGTAGPSLILASPLSN